MSKTKICALPSCRQRYDVQPGQSSFWKWCGTEHAYQHARIKQVKAQDKKAKQKEKEWNAETKRRKDALKTTSDWIKTAKAAVNKYIRARDIHLNCVSCDRTNAEVESTEGWKPGGSWDAGHFKAVGTHPELRFNTWNVHKQCKSCNGGAGQYVKKNHTVDKQYREILIDRIGLARVEKLEGPNPPLQPNIEYLKRVTKIFNKRTRHIKKLRGL